ncbi:hypothetical protein BDQ12DRAFT_613708 [Crucibulum laeve]|uniref:NAD(P)-binding protein n=1 Tax=Crucibulum laeve TaxID=68775 RepID=A0A5C3LPX9_9AGAR|nr:hypothetical protein BDQ12DRAFT_613708 [Crucibulum laeve]
MNPFSPRNIPPLTYTLQNIVIALSSLLVALFSLLLTVVVFLPLSFLRACTPTESLKHNNTPLPQKEVVLVVGASHGIGYNVVRQYVNRPNTTIIAVSRHMGTPRCDACTTSTKATSNIHLEVLDIGSSNPRTVVVNEIQELDKKYGPITRLYAKSGITTGEDAWGLDVALDMIQVNVVGIVTVVLAMYKRMRVRGYGKICIVGSTVGIFEPANMIAYASTKAFINTFANSLRILAMDGHHPIDIILTTPGYIDTRMTRLLRSQGARFIPAFVFRPAEGMAENMIKAVEGKDGWGKGQGGGRGWVVWPLWQGTIMFGLQALNPISEDLGRYIGWKSRFATRRKVT